jgi:predicted AlkP superfamily phosphohydrolase/phosphomutase
VVNVPVTHPAHEFKGSLVPGYLAAENPTCLVDGRPRRLDDIDPEYRIYAERNEPDERTLREYERLVRSRGSLAERLADSHDWSFLMVQFQRTDSVYHTFGDDTEAAGRVYEAVDDAIGSLLASIDEECNVLVVSDHGIWQYQSVFYINTWLRNQGYLETTAASERIGWSETTKQRLRNDGDDSLSVTAKLGYGAAGALKRVGLTPQRVESLLSTVGLDETVKRLVPLDVIERSVDHVDWQMSRAYCRSASSLGLRCNVAGRERDGVVSDSEFPATRRHLVDQLQALETPAGEPVFDEVIDRHDAWGSDVSNALSAPDILLRPRGMRIEVSDILKTKTFEETDVFNHNYEGLLIASGPDIEWERSIQPRVTDIAPTVLSLLGLAPPDVMDGGPLESIIDPPHDLSLGTATQRQYLAEPAERGPEQAVKDRLRDMGYME